MEHKPQNEVVYQQIYIEHNTVKPSILHKLRKLKNKYQKTQENYNILVNDSQQIWKMGDIYYNVYDDTKSHSVDDYFKDTNMYINSKTLVFNKIYNIPEVYKNIRVEKEIYTIAENLQFCVEYNYIKYAESALKTKTETESKPNTDDVCCSIYTDNYFILPQSTDIHHRDTQNTLYSFLNDFY